MWSFDRRYICLQEKQKKKLLIPAEIKGYCSLTSGNEGCFLPGICSSRVYRYSVTMVSVCCLMLHLPVKKIEDELFPLPRHYLYIYLYMRDIVIVCTGDVASFDLVTLFIIEINQ